MLFDSWVADLLAVVAVLLAAAYYKYIVLSDAFWREKNVPNITRISSFRIIIKLITGEMNILQVMDHVYNTFKENGYGGITNGNTPMLVVCDPELAKTFLTKDFTSFNERGLPHDKKDPFSVNLLHLSGQRWKDLRGKLTPTFTSGRIKWMFPLMQECTQELKEYIEKEIKKDDSIEMKELLIRYMTDVIGSCAFGIQCNSIQNPKEEFYMMSQERSKKSRKGGMGRIVYSVVEAYCEDFLRLFTSKPRFSKLNMFFTELMDHTIKYRKENNIERNDFVQLMMKIMEEDSTKHGEMKFSQELMTTQAFGFFLAGLNNLSLNIGFCLHALAVDQELQERVHHEISTVLEHYEGKMCYDALNKMDLVSRVLDEGLRMYSPIPVHMRKQTDAKYVVPGTNIELEKGTAVVIPLQSIHNDEQFFPNPRKFDPDRFTEEEKAKRHPYAYTPFGEGPRMCIAARFAKVLMALTLAELVRHFKFSAGPKTDIVMELNPNVLTPEPKNDFWFRVTVR